MKKAITVFALLILAFMFVGQVFAGGGQEAEGGAKKDLVIGKIPITMEANYHQAHVKHLINYAKEEYGAEVTVIDGAFSSDVAMSAVETFIAQGVDGILLHSTDEKVIDSMVEEAHRADIPITTFYIPTASRSVPHLQINEAETSFQMGVAAAEKWKEWYPGKPIKIGVIDYLTVEIVQEHRTGPFIEGVMSVAPDAEVVSKLEGSASVNKAMNAMQDMLQAHPEVNIVYGANADHALGALAALENAGRGKAVDGKCLTEIVVGTDGTEGELLKVYDPSSSMKITQGLQPAVNAKAEMDLFMKVYNGEIPRDEWLNVDTFDKFISYWETPIEEAQEFISYQYFSDVDLEEAIGGM